jgi:hypothetical protein
MNRRVCSLVSVCGMFLAGISLAGESATLLPVAYQPPSVQESPSDIVNPRAVQKPTQKPVQKGGQACSSGSCGKRLSGRGRLLGRR